MEQYIPKSALVAEIERLNPPFYPTLAEKISYQDAIKDCIDIIYTIKAKEMDLKKEIDFAMPSKYCWSGDGEAVYSKEQMRNFAKHFFELGLLSTITEEDCKLIWNIGDGLPYMPEEDFFEELLRRYKAQKGK